MFRMNASKGDCAHMPFRVLARGLGLYGRWVCRYPWMFVLLPCLVFGSLTAGLVWKMLHSSVISVQDANMPLDSQASKDQAEVQRLFPDRTGSSYDALELSEDQIMGSLIFKAKHNASVYDDNVVSEILHVIADIKANVTVLMDGVVFRYEDLCARRQNACVVTGERLLSPQFDAMRKSGILTYPKWKLPTTGDLVDLSFALADSDSELKKVGVVRVTFKLRHDRKPHVFAWEDAFVRFMGTVALNYSDFVFASSRSFSQEQASEFQADLPFLWLALGLIVCCTCIVVTCSCNGQLATRTLLLMVEVVSSTFGVIEAMALLSFCGVKVVQLVWVMPLLILGISLANVNLLMTAGLGIAGDSSQRVIQCLVVAGPSITLASLSLSIALCAAYTVFFPSVANFGIYAGVAVMLCYLTTMTLGVGCLASHNKSPPCDQFSQNRNETTSVADGPRKEAEHRNSYKDWISQRFQTVSTFTLLKLTGSIIGKMVIGVIFFAILATSLYGIANLKLGVKLTALIMQSAYIYDYLVLDAVYFGFSFPVVFVMDQRNEYNNATVYQMLELMNKTMEDPGIEDDFTRCWLTDFEQSSYYNRTQEGENFPVEVVKSFVSESTTFGNDVVFEDTGSRIVASRCYIFSKRISDDEEVTQLMQRMRSLAGAAGFPVFAYHPAFLNCDQRLAILPTLFRSAGIAVVTVCALFVILFPEPAAVVTLIISVLTTVLGTLGLMYFTEIAFSFVSLPHLIFSFGFAVYFSVHVSAAYAQSDFTSPSTRAADAVSRAAGPILNAVLGIAMAVLALLATTSYYFAVLWKVVLLTLLLTLFTSTLLTPVLLSLFGCEKSPNPKAVHNDALHKEDVIKQRPLPKTPSKTSGSISLPNPKGPGSAKPNSYVNFPASNPAFKLEGSGTTSGEGQPNEPLVDYPYQQADDFPYSVVSNYNCKRRPESGLYGKNPLFKDQHTSWPGQISFHAAELFHTPGSPDPRVGRDRTARGEAEVATAGSFGLRPNGSAGRLETRSQLPHFMRDRGRHTDKAVLRRHFRQDCPLPTESFHFMFGSLSTTGKLGSTQAYVAENHI